MNDLVSCAVRANETHACTYLPRGGHEVADLEGLELEPRLIEAVHHVGHHAVQAEAHVDL